MIRVKKSDRKELLSLFNQAVKQQVQLYNQLSAVEELTGHVTGLDDWVFREAADYDKPEYVKLTTKQLTYMLQDVKPEK
jgi:hypothetical protein